MLHHSNGTMNGHAVNGHVLINGKEHGSKSGVPLVPLETESARAPSLGPILEAVKRPSRKAAVKGTTKAKIRKVQHFARPYALPRLFDSSTAISGGNLEEYCRSIVRAAWEAGKYHGRSMKAAREKIVRSRLTLADIAAVARSLADYNRRPWGPSCSKEESEWLYSGSGCCERRGTVYESHIAAWPALSAALSIIVEAPPLEDPDDADALLQTLIYTGWRHVPRHQQALASRRIARFVNDSVSGEALWCGRTY